jgi:hypothetical protein
MLFSFKKYFKDYQSTVEELWRIASGIMDIVEAES